uniref:Uncharacterized protein n=1 Tax=viral metagenome TaxID=1070528 RepID=A0A6M3JLW1_9ZZZZ
MKKIINFSKNCISCGDPNSDPKDDHCPKCIKYFHDQWHVTWGVYAGVEGDEKAPEI